MMLGDFEEKLSSVVNDSTGDSEKMKSQDFEASRPPRLRQRLSFRHRENVVSEMGELQWESQSN